jgi:hypothetical protein
VHGPHPDQVVPTVVRRPEHDATGRRERLARLVEVITGQERDVAAEEDRGVAVKRLEQMRKGGTHSAAEVSFDLWHARER